MSLHVHPLYLIKSHGEAIFTHQNFSPSLPQPIFPSNSSHSTSFPSASSSPTNNVLHTYCNKHYSLYLLYKQHTIQLLLKITTSAQSKHLNNTSCKINRPCCSCRQCHLPMKWEDLWVAQINNTQKNKN